ncbi:MAG: DUF389 domain-containing protein [Solidesulfovibrio sp. DCME]|uniref:DUF389 domain-containing protein n=1 Tax=Solidesulfovibrio sp. DCME TaxID=3447380 RepID=UPI003D0DD813
MDGTFSARLRRFRIANEKAERVAADIAQGSTPAIGFYALIATASLIASLGLVANSPAVIIGAMLVSPLMSPIFGLALGMIRGDAHLLGKAAQAEVSGMALAVAFGALFGLLPVMTEITPEMLARTEPTLLDLLVAVFAGFAGTLAMIDDRISPALPGVAIATAIVPPLATCGLCLAHGSTAAASGAFLLFFANFVAILLVSAMTFLVAGLTRHADAAGNSRRVAGNMALTILGFLLVSAYLTHSLTAILRDHRQHDQVKAAVEQALRAEPAATLVSLQRKDLGDSVDVLVAVRSPRSLDPRLVADMEEAVSRRIGKKVRLGARSLLTKDIYPPGGGGLVAVARLDGGLFTDKVSDDVRHLQQAEQCLREMLADRPQMLLLDVNLVKLGNDPVVMATVQTARPLLPVEIREAEGMLRDRLGVANLRLLARCLLPEDIASDGRILYGKAHFGPDDPEADAVAEAVRRTLEALPLVYVTALDVVRAGERYQARVDITGARVITSQEVKAAEAAAAAATGKDVVLAARSRVGLMVTDAEAMPVEEYTRRRILENRETEEKLPQRPEAGETANTAPSGGR